MKTTLVSNKSINIKCYIAFARFLMYKDFETLLSDLKEIEHILIGGRKTDKSLWFRFFDGDTLVTDLRDIERYFVFINKNSDYFIESVETALNDISLQVHFS